MIMRLAMQHWGYKLYNVQITYIPWMALTAYAKFAFRMETCVIKSFNPYTPGVLYLCIENRK